MRKRYKLKQPLKRDGRVIAKAGEPVAITRAQHDAYLAGGLIDGPADPDDAWPVPNKPKTKPAKTG